MAIRVTPIRMPGSSGHVSATGNMYMVLASLVFEGEYPRGGERVSFETNLTHGVSEIISVFFTDPAGNALEYDRRNRKVMVFGEANRELEDRARYNAAITEDRNIVAMILAK